MKFKNKGVVIAFLGTDGSGKSTIIELIKPVLSKHFDDAIYYEHLRPNYFSSLARLAGKNECPGEIVAEPHKNKPSGFIGSLLRFCYYYIDYTVGYCVKVYPKKVFKSCVWIFDRYYYDYFIDQRRLSIKLPLWIVRLGQIFIPKPDLIICLGTSPDKIHTRKPELPLIEVERQVNALKQFASTHKRAVWVDTGTSVEESYNAALQHIVAMMAKRFQKVKLR